MIEFSAYLSAMERHNALKVSEGKNKTNMSCLQLPHGTLTLNIVAMCMLQSILAII